MSANKRILHVGLVQQSLYSNDKAANREKTATHVESLAAEGCELVVLQELHTTMYFCQSEDPQNFDLAEPIPGPSTEFFGALAKRLNIVLVTSLFERRAPGLYHNTAVVFDKSSDIAGMYRKMHIPDDPGFYEKFYFTPGDMGFTPIQTSAGTLGVLVCWDQWYPEASRLMALAGADILMYPTAIGWDMTDDPDERQRQLDAWITVQRGHAIANSLPIIAPNRCGFEAAPASAGQNGDDGIHFWGNSFIAGPQGEFLARAEGEGEVLLHAHIDMERSETVKRMWPYFRDRRIDAYQDVVKRWRD